MFRSQLTKQIGKEGAVYDYVSYPAMPYYFWGIKNILQVDSVDEVNSMEKCAKVHKKELNIIGILYPEIISKNGVDTIFNAERKHKNYV